MDFPMSNWNNNYDELITQLSMSEKYKKISDEIFHKISSYKGLTLYDKILLREVLLKLYMKAIEGQEIYKMEAEISESVEEAIFAEGAKKGLSELMEFIQDELNEFECPPSGTHGSPD